MKFVPRYGQIIGRMVTVRAPSQIIRVNEGKVSVFVLVDAAGPDAVSAGIVPGSVIVPLVMAHVILEDARRPMVEEKSVAFFARDLLNSDLLIQNEKGDRFVAFDSDEAAKPLGGGEDGVAIRASREMAQSAPVAEA